MYLYFNLLCCFRHTWHALYLQFCFSSSFTSTRQGHHKTRAGSGFLLALNLCLPDFPSQIYIASSRGDPMFTTFHVQLNETTMLEKQTCNSSFLCLSSYQQLATTTPIVGALIPPPFYVSNPSTTLVAPNSDQQSAIKRILHRSYRTQLPRPCSAPHQRKPLLFPRYSILGPTCSTVEYVNGKDGCGAQRIRSTVETDGSRYIDGQRLLNQTQTL